VDGTLKLWDATTGREIRAFSGHRGMINAVVFSPDGRLAMSGGADNALKLWETATGRELRALQHGDEVHLAAFSPDGQLALSGSKDGTVCLWDIQHGEELVKFIALGNGEWVAVTPDGYYDSSPAGEEGMYWVTQPGIESFSVQQFASLFRRPDIIRARLANDRSAGRPAPGFTRPPLVELVESPEGSITSGFYDLNLIVRAVNEVKGVRAYVNGRLALEAPVNKQTKELVLEVPLAPGANRITAVAYDDKGFTSRPRDIEVLAPQTNLAQPYFNSLTLDTHR